MKANGLDVPRYITFSGTGSKLLNITDPSPGIKKLVEYTTVIFEDVYGEPITSPLEIKQFNEPKEITCKGGLLCSDYSALDEIESKIKTVWIGDINKTIVPKTDVRYNVIQQDQLVESVLAEVKVFISKFFEWSATFNYNNKFGINPSRFPKYEAWLKEDLKQFLLAGIKEKLNEVKENTNITVEESLFFYPLVGGLNKLAYNIFSLTNDQEQ